MTQSELFAKFDKFLTDYNNKYVKVLPNDLNPQCFDLDIKWTDILGVPHAPGNPSPFPYANASQIYTDFGPFQAQYFNRIENPPVGSPIKGDIIVWAYYYNYAGGHTGMATGKGQSTGASSDWFECFEQNDPTGSNSHLKIYNYSAVLGWLRFKTTADPTDPYIEKAKTLKTAVDRLKNESDAQYSGNKEQYYKDTTAKCTTIGKTGTL